MISFGNAASSHSGLIPLKTAYKKRGELLWGIASKKDFINLHFDYFPKKYPVYANNWLVVTDCRESRNGERHGSSCRMQYLII